MKNLVVYRFLVITLVLALIAPLASSPLSVLANPNSEIVALDCDDPNVICVEGELSTDETWSSENVYVLDSDVTVASGTTLTILPGTVIKSRFQALEIAGTLIAEGTAAEPIVFTSLLDDSRGGDTNNDESASAPAPSNWDNLQFVAGSAGSMRYVELHYFGADGERSGGIYTEVSAVTLDNVTFSNGRDLNPPITVAADTIPAISNISMDQMQYQGVELRGGDITTNVTWFNQGLVYFLLDDVTVAPGATLTVNPGVLVKARSAALIINGEMTVDADAETMVTFTSYRDDRVGGDTNGDGFNMTVHRDWDGIQFMNGSQGDLDYIHVRHASGGAQDGGIYSDGAQLLIQNCILTRNNEGFASSGLSTLPNIRNCDIYENRLDGAVNVGPVEVSASYNWWGSSAGPNDRSDADGKTNESPNGEDVSDFIQYSPWLDTKIHPEIILEQTELQINATAGGNNPSIPPLAVTTVGDGELEWSAESNVAWLSAAQSSDTTPSLLMVNVDTTGLEPGEYTGSIAAAWGKNQATRREFVEITMIVVAPESAAPGFSVTPSKLSFFGREDMISPPPLSVTIANTGTGTLDWTVTTDLPWLTLSKSAGTADDSIEATVSFDGLTEGIYSGEVLIESPNALNGPIALDTELTLGCRDSQPLDVVLVFDRSGSMSSTKKIGKAKEAAIGFIQLLDLSRDQVSLVSFDHDPLLDKELSQDGASVAEAIDALDAGGGTDIHEALALAQEEALSSRQKDGNLPLILLLSDGQDGGQQDILDQAFSAKSQGVYIVTVGLGNAEEELLTQVASYDKDYYYAPEASELAALYNSIAVTVGCNVAGTGVFQMFLPVTQ